MIPFYIGSIIGMVGAQWFGVFDTSGSYVRGTSIHTAQRKSTDTLLQLVALSHPPCPLPLRTANNYLAFIPPNNLPRNPLKPSPQPPPNIPPNASDHDSSQHFRNTTATIPPFPISTARTPRNDYSFHRSE